MRERGRPRNSSSGNVRSSWNHRPRSFPFLFPRCPSVGCSAVPSPDSPRSPAPFRGDAIRDPPEHRFSRRPERKRLPINFAPFWGCCFFPLPWMVLIGFPLILPRPPTLLPVRFIIPTALPGRLPEGLRGSPDVLRDKEGEGFPVLWVALSCLMLPSWGLPKTPPSLFLAIVFCYSLATPLVFYLVKRLLVGFFF